MLVTGNGETKPIEQRGLERGLKWQAVRCAGCVGHVKKKCYAPCSEAPIVTDERDGVSDFQRRIFAATPSLASYPSRVLDAVRTRTRSAISLDHRIALASWVDLYIPRTPSPTKPDPTRRHQRWAQCILQKSTV